MSRIQRWIWKRNGYLSGRPEVLWKELVGRYAAGKTFVDVGCMWKVHGEYALHALASGAVAVTGIDQMDATSEFAGRNAEHGGGVRFLKGDLNDPAIDTWAGLHDVVFCSGVLYHVPNPVYSILQMRRLCAETLILTSASTMDGAVPNAMVFLPGLRAEERAALTFQTTRGGSKIGLDSTIDANLGYAPWYWLPTPSAIRSMVEAAGFDVKEIHRHRRVTTIVASKVREPILPPL